MRIGEVARLTGVSGKTIRYYEEIGLLPAAGRSANGYRTYGAQAVSLVRFVRRARDLGFSLKEVADLVALWTDDGRHARDVRTLAEQHLETIERRLSELEALRRTLVHLIDRCEGDERPDCPILDDLADPDPAHQN